MHLKNTSIALDQILPQDMAPVTRPCPNFICRGLECTHSPATCPYGKHMKSPKEIPKADLQKLAEHCYANKHAWFNRNAIERISDHYKVPTWMPWAQKMVSISVRED